MTNELFTTMQELRKGISKNGAVVRYATARQNGWMSTNDIRELENLDKIPAEQGGDLYLINGNMMPIAMAGSQYQNNTGTEENTDENKEVLELGDPGSERKRIGR